MEKLRNRIYDGSVKRGLPDFFQKYLLQLKINTLGCVGMGLTAIVNVFSSESQAILLLH